MTIIEAIAAAMPADEREDHQTDPSRAMGSGKLHSMATEISVLEIR